MLQLIGLKAVECDDIKVLEFNLKDIGAHFTDRLCIVIGLKFSWQIHGLDSEIVKIKIVNIHTKYLKNATSVDKEEL